MIPRLPLSADPNAYAIRSVDEVAAIMTARGIPMTGKLVRIAEYRAFDRLARNLMSFARAEGLLIEGVK